MTYRGIEIHVSNQGGYEIASLDGYDGAPDATGPYSLTGWGATVKAAIDDLTAQLDEYDEEKF
jgi:hypothetical protein